MLDIVADRVATADVVAVEPHRARRVISTLALAFAADPPSRWLFPEPESYLQHFPAFARALAGSSLQRRTGLATGDYGAVALWLAPGEGPDEEAMADLIDEEVDPDRKDDLAAVIEEMSRHHPLEPHWYLPFIGVEPSRQGHGLGSILLRNSLARVDAEGLPAYLESTNPRNRPLYERHGFEALGEIRIGSCPPIVPMLRRGRG